jgi:hypothetical protein
MWKLGGATCRQVVEEGQEEGLGSAGYRPHRCGLLRAYYYPWVPYLTVAADRVSTLVEEDPVFLARPATEIRSVSKEVSLSVMESETGLPTVPCI